MKPTKLWPPGGGTSIEAHPSKVAEMVARGWTTEAPSKPKALPKPRGKKQ